MYSLPERVDPDPENQEKIKHIFHTLCKKEKVGIFVSVEVFDDLNTYIVPADELHELFIDPPKHVVTCYNYPDSDKMNDFDLYAPILAR